MEIEKKKSGIRIKDAKKNKCPKCNSIFSIENTTENLYRNITLLYINHNQKKMQIKCRQCKYWIEVTFSKENNSIIDVQ